MYDQGFLKAFRDPIRVPRIQNRIPRIRKLSRVSWNKEKSSSLNQRNRVPTGPYWVPDIFLKKNPGMTNHFCAFVNDNRVVGMIKYFFPPLHGHVQIALLCD